VLFFNAFELGAENANQVIMKEALGSTIGVFSIMKGTGWVARANCAARFNIFIP
jgi:hypothetical protein